MKLKPVFEKGLNKCPIEYFTNNQQVLTNQQKEKLVEYLKKGEEYGFTSQPAQDFVTGEVLGDEVDNLLTDGQYFWSFSTAYHVDKYNIKLLDEFVDYVLKE